MPNFDDPLKGKELIFYAIVHQITFLPSVAQSGSESTVSGPSVSVMGRRFTYNSSANQITSACVVSCLQARFFCRRLMSKSSSSSSLEPMTCSASLTTPHVS